MPEIKVSVRRFDSKDTGDVRRISCQTAFLGQPWQDFIGDEEILADALTLYFTKYEPQSCFVAVTDNKVIGYIIGSTDVQQLHKVCNRNILPALFFKAIGRGFFFKKKTLRFVAHLLISLFRGEFLAPDFSREYPATLHININAGYRRNKVGESLIQQYLAFLKDNHIRGVHFGTMSDEAKQFFIKQGFVKLFESRRTYLKYYSGMVQPFYILGKIL